MIARELLVKLGFDIDIAKFDQFTKKADDLKAKVAQIQKEVLPTISPQIKELVAPKATEPRPETQNQVAPKETDRVTEKFNNLLSYHKELKALSQEDRVEVKALNALEKQAIREVTQEEKQKHKEIAALEKEREKRILQSKKDLKDLAQAGSAIAKKVAIFSAAVTGGFMLSLKGVLKDAKNQQEGKKTDSNFSGSDLKNIDSFNKSLEKVKNTVTELRNSFVIGMLPAIKEFLEPLNLWLKTNKELIKQRMVELIKGIGTAFSTAASVVLKVVNALDTVIKNTVGWEFAIKAVVGIGLTTWAASAAFSIFTAARAFWALTTASLAFLATPLGLAIAAITAATVLLGNEIYVTLAGGDSLYNRFKDSSFGKYFIGNIEIIIDRLKDLYKWISKIWKFELKMVGKLGKGIDDFTDFVKDKFSDIPELKFTVNKRPQGLPNYDNKHNEPIKAFLPNSTPDDIVKTYNGSQAKENTVNNSNTFNITMNVPQGTTPDQAKTITNLVQKELEKYTRYSTEKTLAAIGAH